MVDELAAAPELPAAETRFPASVESAATSARQQWAAQSAESITYHQTQIFTRCSQPVPLPWRRSGTLIIIISLIGRALRNQADSATCLATAASIQCQPRVPRPGWRFPTDDHLFAPAFRSRGPEPALRQERGRPKAVPWRVDLPYYPTESS